jgi:hypothetical protein
MYQLTFYVPETHLEQVKQAVFAVGAGRYNNYDCCCWQTLGQGQYRPMEGSSPFIGEENKVEHVPEYKVEMVLHDECRKEVLRALKESHPYEELAFLLVKAETT